MSKLTNKNLQRMIELMGNKKPINEGKLTNSVELVKHSPNGKSYGIVKENKKYFIKESNDNVNFEFIGGIGNKSKHQFSSYEEATKELNFMFETFNKKYDIQEGTDILSSDINEDKKFVLKSKKKKSPTSTDLDFDFGGSGDLGGDMSFGDEEGDDSQEFDFGSEEGDDFGGDEEGDDVDDPIKGIQKMTGKLGQKIRDTEDMSSDMTKWVAKSVLSALDLEDMDSNDKKDLINTIKSEEDEYSDEGGDEDFDFMEDEEIVDEEPIMDWDSEIDDSDDSVIWNNLTPEERDEVIMNSYLNNDFEDEEFETEFNYENDLTDDDIEGNFRRQGQSQLMMFPPEDVDYMEEDDEELYGPGDGSIDTNEILLDDTYPYEEKTDYMSKFNKDVNRNEKTRGKTLDQHELDTHLRKLQNKLGGSRNVSIDGNSVVGEFGYIEVTNNGYNLHKEGDKFSKRFGFNELGRLKSATSVGRTSDYMDDIRMNPAPAPAKPSTQPGPDVKPGRPDTDKPNPSKRPFSPPPHIRPGEEPSPKAEYEDYMDDDLEMGRTLNGRPSKNRITSRGNLSRNYLTDTQRKNREARKQADSDISAHFDTQTNLPYDTKFSFDDYMDDVEKDENCPDCFGRGHERASVGFGANRPSTCNTCQGSGKKTIEDLPSEKYIDEPFVKDAINDYTSDITNPRVNKVKYSYREKFPFPIGENKIGKKKTLKEDHLNDKMVSLEQEQAYEDVESMARENGLTLSFCHKDKSTDPEEKTVYLDLKRGNDNVGKVRINSVGEIEMGTMKTNSFKGQPVDSLSDFDEVLGEKKIKTPMNPAPAPAKPSTQPGPDVKPGRPDTDRPNPSKRPFSPPPHIRPGEEPSPKAKNRRKIG